LSPLPTPASCKRTRALLTCSSKSLKVMNSKGPPLGGRHPRKGLGP
jgi:hypothetical protein